MQIQNLKAKGSKFKQDLNAYPLSFAPAAARLYLMKVATFMKSAIFGF